MSDAMRSLSVLRTLAWDDMTRQERAKLLIEDYEAYVEMVPSEYWFLMLDQLAKHVKVEPDRGVEPR